MKRVAREDHTDQDLLSKAKSQIKGCTLKTTPFPKPIKKDLEDDASLGNCVSQDLGGTDCMARALREGPLRKSGNLRCLTNFGLCGHGILKPPIASPEQESECTKTGWRLKLASGAIIRLLKDLRSTQKHQTGKETSLAAEHCY